MYSIIAAISKNNVIGKCNDIPWHYPTDLKHFKEITIGKTVLMGYHTYQSILNRLGKPLPNRKNIVLTSHEIKEEDVIVVKDIFRFLEQKHEEEIFVIGGRQVYNLFIDQAEKLYITHIDKEFDGDTYFPLIDYSQFNLMSERIEGELRFCVYERKRAS
jgi:dihydrofolate reductase